MRMRSAQPSPAASWQGYLTLWGPRGPAGLTALLRTNTTRGLQADAESTQATARLGEGVATPDHHTGPFLLHDPGGK